MGNKLKVDEVCKRIGISRSQLKQMQFRGDAPPRIQVSARIFVYDEDSLEEWLMARERRSREAVHA